MVRLCISRTLGSSARREGRSLPSPAENVQPANNGLVGVLLGLVAVATTLEPGLNNDTWWHLALGRWTWEHGAIPLHEPFQTLREDAYWVRSGWLAGLGMYGVHALAGAAGLRVVTSVVIGATTVSLWWRTRGPLLVRLPIVTVALLALNSAAVPRPFVLAFPLLVLVEGLLARERDKPSRLVWWLPATTAVWANLHGTFILVPILIGMEFVGALVGRARDPARARRLAVVGLASIAAITINPFGPRLLLYPFQLTGLESVALIEEWQPPLTVFPEAMVFAAMVVGILTAVVLGRRRLHPADVLRLVGFTVLGATALRHMAVLAVVAVPVVSRMLSDRGQERVARSRPGLQRTADVVLVAAVVAAVAVVGWPAASPAENERAVEQAFPVGAAEAIKRLEVADARVWHPYGWGGYLLWEFQDRIRLFVDSRAELFGDELVELTAEIGSAEQGWEEEFARYGVEVAVVRAGSALDRAMADEWTVLHRDDVAVVYGLQ